MSLTNKVLLSLIIGIFIGLLLNITGLSQVAWVNNLLIEGIFSNIGKLFINALKMIVVPLILFSIIHGVLGLGDVKKLGRIGGLTFALYIFTTAAAISSGVLFAALVDLGKGGAYENSHHFIPTETPSFSEMLVSIVPTNPIAAMANGDMLAIIFFAIFFGVALLSLAKESNSLISFVEQGNAVVMKMVTMVMWFAPYAVFCLIAKVVAQLGIELLLQLTAYLLVVLATLLFHTVVTQCVLFKTFTGLSFIVFLKKIRAPQLFAFSTASSGATIPVSMRALQERLGVSRSISSFTVPFGATINMDGTAIMQGVATVFLANLFGHDLALADYVTVVIAAVLASVGTAAVPSVGLVMLAGVLAQVGISAEGIGIIIGVDRLLDMARTCVNVTGDGVVTLIIAKKENMLDTDTFHDPEAGLVYEQIAEKKSENNT